MRPGQGPPPPWGFWPPIPFMGYGPRPPIDMSGKNNAIMIHRINTQVFCAIVNMIKKNLSKSL